METNHQLLIPHVLLKYILKLQPALDFQTTKCLKKINVLDDFGILTVIKFMHPKLHTKAPRLLA